MTRFTKSILVPAAAEDVFRVIDDPANLALVWRNLSNIRNQRRLPNGGIAFEFDYTMAGITIKGTSVDLEHIFPTRIVTRTTGGVSSTLTFVFRPNLTGQGTHVDLTVEYDVPLPLVGKMAEVVVAKINESDIVYALNYLMLKFAVHK